MADEGLDHGLFGHVRDRVDIWLDPFADPRGAEGPSPDGLKDLRRATGPTPWPILSPPTARTRPPAAATPPDGFVGTPVSRGEFQPMDVAAPEVGQWSLQLKSTAISDILVTRNAIATGGHSGWHRHPGPSLISVTAGEIVAYESHDPDCRPVRYRAGQGFIDYGDHAHLLRNESGAPAETIAVQIVPAGSNRRIDAKQPDNCEVTGNEAESH